MLRRACWLVGSAVLALVLGGCTTSPSAPPSTTLATPTATASVVDPSLSSASPLSANPTPSVIDPSALAPIGSSGVSMGPLPAGLTNEEISDAEAAIEVYRRFWQLSDESAGDPARDWGPQIAEVATAGASDSFSSGVAGLKADGIRLVGQTVVEASIAKVEPALVHVAACVDVSGTDLLDSSGNSVGVDDGTGAYQRFPTTAQIGKFNGRWLVVVDTFDRTTTC